MDEVLVLERGYNYEGGSQMAGLKLPQTIQKSLESGAYAAGGMLLSRFAAPRIIGAFSLPANGMMRIGIKAGIAIGVGIAGNQFLSRERATLLVVGALADIFADAWNQFAPAGLQLEGNLGIAVPQEASPVRSFPRETGFPNLSGNGFGLQFNEIMPALR